MTGFTSGGRIFRPKWRTGAVWMTSPSVKGTLRLPLDDLRSIIVLRPGTRHGPTRTASGTPWARWNWRAARLRGRLEDGREEPGASCLVWHPVGSAAASPLRTGISRPHRLPRAPAAAQDRSAAGTPQRQIRVQINGSVMQQPGLRRPPAKGSTQPSLYLRTGDTIPPAKSDENR